MEQSGSGICCGSFFAVWTGYEEKIRESTRITDQRIELDEYEIVLLDEKQQRIDEMQEREPEVMVGYFQPDQRKSGGAYLTVTGKVKKIDRVGHQMLFCDGTVIDINQIYDIVSEYSGRK